MKTHDRCVVCEGPAIARRAGVRPSTKKGRETNHKAFVTVLDAYARLTLSLSLHKVEVFGVTDDPQDPENTSHYIYWTFILASLD